MIWAGLAALAVAAVCGYLTHAAHRRARSMESTETLPVRDLLALHAAAAQAAGEGAFRYRCEVTGVTRPHRDGALRSGLAGVECVWHRHRITRRYEETYRDSRGYRKRRTSTEVLSEHTSTTAFLVEDGTGRVAIRPAGHRVVGAEKVLDRFDPPTGGVDGSGGGGDGDGTTIGFRHEEWLVRPGSPFYVHGEAADADGPPAVGAPAGGGVFLMSVKSERELLRDENRNVLGFGAAAGVAAVAGMVFAVLAAVR